MLRHGARFVLSSILLVLLGSGHAQAQGGEIRGVVRDSTTGTPLSEAFVTVLDEAGIKIAEELTDADGVFVFSALPSGQYSIEVLYAGRRAVRLEGQVVSDGGTVTLSVFMAFQLHPLDALVVSVSKTTEKLTEAPAAVQITRFPEIARRPSTTLVDHVTGHAGVDVVTTGLQSHNVVIRGFNNVLSGGLLALTDHRIARLPSIRANIAYLVPTTSLDLDRIEVVLGSASALYGPNADNGVVHSITRSPIDDPGVSLSLVGGLREQASETSESGGTLLESSEEGLFHGSARIAARTGEKFGFKVSGQYFGGVDYRYVDEVEAVQRDLAAECLSTGIDLATDSCLNFAQDLDLSRSADVELLARSVGNVAGGRDPDIERWSVDARLDWRPSEETSLVVAGGRASALSGVDLTPLGAVQVLDWSYDYAQVRFRHGDLFGQAFLNRNDNTQTYLLRSGRPLRDNSEQLAVQIQHASRAGHRHSFVYGADLLHTNPETDGTINGKFERDDTITELGTYLQWLWAPHPRLDVVAAARIDHSSRLGRPVFSPRVAAVFKPTPEHGLRATLNRAFSTPSSVSLFLDISGGTVPVGGPFSYDIRATGSAGTGFSFARDAAGTPMHQSPFAPLLGGGPRDFLPTTTEQLWAEAIAIVSAQSAEAGALLGAIAPPTDADVPVVPRLLDPDRGTFAPVSGGLAGIEDLPGLDPATTTTFEVGYKGVLGRGMVFASAWYSRVSDKISDQRVISPNVFLGGDALEGYLTGEFLGLVGVVFPDEATARATAAQLASEVAMIPLGVITPEQAGGTFSTIVLADRNLPAFDVWGAEVGLRLGMGAWEAEGTISVVGRDEFTPGGGAPIVRLNAPTLKGAGTLRYRGNGAGITGQIRFRGQNGFSASSGVYSGEVEGHALVDVGIGYTLPGLHGTRLQMDVQNLFNSHYRGFVGAPRLGRVLMVGVAYDFEPP